MPASSPATSQHAKENRVDTDRCPPSLSHGPRGRGIAVLQEDAEELIEGLGKRSTGLDDALRTTLTPANGH